MHVRRRWRPPSVHVDRVVPAGGFVAVTGWARDGASTSVVVDGVAVQPQVRVARPDVEEVLGGDCAVTGWVALAAAGTPAPVIEVAHDGRPVPVPAADPGQLPVLLQETAPQVAAVLDAVDWDPAWVRAALAVLPAAESSALAQLEWSEAQGGQGFAAGWSRALGLRLVDEASGRSTPLGDSYRYPRPDVTEAFPDAGPEAGWFTRVDGLAAGPSTVCVVGIQDGVLTQLGRRAWSELPSGPVEAARRLFGVLTPLQDMARRLDQVDGDFLAACVDAQRVKGADTAATRLDFGPVPAAPTVSVVLPVYGRSDLLHHQFLRFARDAELGVEVEVVVVLDDPALAASLPGDAELMWALYGVPFSLVLGGAQRGYSGANNLGARFSRGRTLVFLNSDALATDEGWALRLDQVLQDHPEVGAVGVVLANTDGTAQHIGMRPTYSTHWRAWLNEHPLAGISLDSIELPTSPYVVPAASGACLALRAEDVAEVGGFSECALIGDFEDSDLCFRLAGRGLHTVVDPSVTMVHLQRQSMSTIGDDQFRQRVVLFNAWWHADRWSDHMLAASRERVLHA